MILLIDVISLLIPLAITTVLYLLYYQVFIKGYVRRIKKAYGNGDYDKATRMRLIAIKKQPLRMSRLLADIETIEFNRIKSTFDK